MNDNKTYKPKPVACKVLIWGKTTNEESFMPHERFEDYVTSGSDYPMTIFSQVRSNVSYINYWNTNDLKQLAKLYKVESDDDFPENSYTYQCVGTINNKQIFLAYIDNATTPYVRIDNYVAQEHESFFKYYGSDSMVKRLSSYPIIGYGFPAYLAVHSRIGSMTLYQGSNQTNIDTLIEQYYKDRYDLYHAINSKDYEWIDSNINSKFYGTKAQRKNKELYKTYLQHLLKQEKECFKSNNTELLTLFNGELNENIECFLDFIQEKLAALEPKQDAPVNKPQQRKPQETQENRNKSIPNITITDNMVTDFASKFGVDTNKKDNYRKILEYIAPLKSAAIAHYLRQCKYKDKKLRSDVLIKELHNWLKDNNFNVQEKYDTFQKTFN